MWINFEIIYYSTMKSQEIKCEILDGIFRSKDGLSTNELTELLNVLIAVAQREGMEGKDLIINRPGRA